MLHTVGVVHGQSLDLASLDQGQGGGETVHHQRDMTTHEIGQSRGRALVAQVLHLDAHQLPHQHARGMAAHARCVGGKVQTFGLLFAIDAELLQIAGGEVFVGDEYQAVTAELGQRLQVFEGLIVDLVGQGRFTDDAALDQQKRVRIFAVIEQVCHGKRTSSAGFGLHDHGLSQLLLHAVCQQASERVCIAACRPAHDHSNGFAGPCWRLRMG